MSYAENFVVRTEATGGKSGGRVILDLPEKLVMSRGARQSMALGVFCQFLGLDYNEARKVYDMPEQVEMEKKRRGRVIRGFKIQLHDTSTDIFQRQPDGSYAATMESLLGRRGPRSVQVKQRGR